MVTLKLISCLEVGFAGNGFLYIDTGGVQLLLTRMGNAVR